MTTTTDLLIVKRRDRFMVIAQNLSGAKYLIDNFCNIGPKTDPMASFANELYEELIAKFKADEMNVEEV
jgi:hypothetical protein